MRGRPRHHDFCVVPNCGGKHYARGYCQRHYRKIMKHNLSGAKDDSMCVVPACRDKMFKGFSRCLAHTLEREYIERGGDHSMLPKEG